MIWADIPKYKGIYKISKNGKVKRQGKILSNVLSGDGYLRVNLFKNGKGKVGKIHRLVIHAFVGPCPKGKEVLHKNGNKLDNRLSNLKYGTSSENHLQKFKDGFRPLNRKMTKEEIKWVRKNKFNIYASTMASMLNVDPRTIHDVIYNKSYVTF